MHARWAVVLAGESREMERSQTALDLFREERIDSLILSGPRIFRSHHESEFSREMLISGGVPKERLFQLPHEAKSTLEEASVIIRQSRLLGIDTLLVITSNYHSARARRIFKKLSDGNPAVRFRIAEKDFDPKAWWSARATQVIWLTEWLKTLYTAWEMRGKQPIDPMETNRGILLLEPNPRISKPEAPVRLHADSASAIAPDTGRTDPAPVSMR